MSMTKYLTPEGKDEYNAYMREYKRNHKQYAKDYRQTHKETLERNQADYWNRKAEAKKVSNEAV